MGNSRPSLDEMKDSLLQSPYYFEEYSKENYRVQMQSYPIEERWKCFSSLVKTVFPYLSTSCINSPTQKSLLIHSHDDDYGSIRALRDFFVLVKPYVDLQQVSSTISHLKHKPDASISELLQMMLSHYVRVHPRCRVFQYLNDGDRIGNVRIIAICDEEKIAIVKAIEDIFHNIADESQRGEETSSIILGNHFQCIVGEIEELSGPDQTHPDMRFWYKERPSVDTEHYSVAYQTDTSIRKEFKFSSKELKAECTEADGSMPFHNSTISAYLQYETSGDTYILTCGHEIRDIPECIDLSVSPPIVLKQKPEKNEESSVLSRWFPWMFKDNSDREWISWMWPNCLSLAKKSTGEISYFMAAYDPSIMLTKTGFKESLSDLKNCVSDVAVISLKKSSIESRKGPMKYVTGASPSEEILIKYTAAYEKINSMICLPPHTSYSVNVTSYIGNRELTVMKVVGQGHHVFSDKGSPPKDLYEIYYVARYVRGVMPIHGHSGAACITDDNKLHSFLTAIFRDVYLLTPAHFSLAQALKLKGRDQSDIAKMKVVNVEWKK